MSIGGVTLGLLEIMNSRLEKLLKDNNESSERISELRDRIEIITLTQKNLFSEVGSNVNNTQIILELLEEWHKSVIKYLEDFDPDCTELDIIEQFVYSSTPLLHMAILYGNFPIVGSLIDKYEQSLHSKDDEGRTPFHIACRMSPKHPNAYKILQVLLEKIITFSPDNDGEIGRRINVCDDYGCTPLYYACLFNNLSHVKSLLDTANDPGVNIINKEGGTPLHAACCENNPSMVNLLLENDANVNVKNAQGETPLHVACRYGIKEVVDILLNVSRDCLNDKDEKGKTPLHYAVMSKSFPLVVHLFEMDDIQLLGDKEGVSPLMSLVTLDRWSYQRQKEPAIEYFLDELLTSEDCDVWKQLLEKDKQAKLHLQNEGQCKNSIDYMSVLLVKAVKENNHDMVELLLRDANPDVVCDWIRGHIGPESDTIHIAITDSKIKMMNQLLKDGLMKTVENENGVITPGSQSYTYMFSVLNKVVDLVIGSSNQQDNPDMKILKESLSDFVSALLDKCEVYVGSIKGNKSYASFFREHASAMYQGKTLFSEVQINEVINLLKKTLNSESFNFTEGHIALLNSVKVNSHIAPLYLLASEIYRSGLSERFNQSVNLDTNTGEFTLGLQQGTRPS